MNHPHMFKKIEELWTVEFIKSEVKKPINFLQEIIFRNLRQFLKRADQYMKNKLGEKPVLTENQAVEIEVGRRLMEKNATIALRRVAREDLWRIA
jgi:hypothetical protein